MAKAYYSGWVLCDVSSCMLVLFKEYVILVVVRQFEIPAGNIMGRFKSKIDDLAWVLYSF
jgi:hypothetical protein